MYVAKFPTALCSLDKTPTQDILKFRQAAWDTPWQGPGNVLRFNGFPGNLINLFGKWEQRMHKTKKPLDTEENAGTAIVISGIGSLRVTLCSYFVPASYMIVLLIQWNGTHHQSIWYSPVSITVGNKSPIENFFFFSKIYIQPPCYLFNSNI